jgi:hypothetical protein
MNLELARVFSVEKNPPSGANRDLAHDSLGARSYLSHEVHLGPIWRSLTVLRISALNFDSLLQRIPATLWPVNRNAGLRERRAHCIHSIRMTQTKIARLELGFLKRFPLVFQGVYIRLGQCL